MSRVLHLPPQAVEIFSAKMKPPGPEAPVVLVKWYDYSKWLLGQMEARHGVRLGDSQRNRLRVRRRFMWTMVTT